MKTRTFTAVAVIAVLGLAACGDDNSSGSVSSSTAPPSSLASTFTSTASATMFNDADVEFVQGMIPHHQQAIEMAQLAPDPKSQAGEAVSSLAAQVAAAQGPEIDLMMGWLTAWGKPLDGTMGGSRDMGGMGEMNGMMSAEEMTALGMAHGTDFDQMWLTLMIRHHEGVVAMANKVRTDGLDPEVAALAGRIIAAQQAEIDEMKPLIEA